MVFNSDSDKNLFLREAHFGRGGILFRGGTINKRGNPRCGKTFRLQPKNLVVLGAIKAFHRAGIDSQQRSTGQEIAEGDVSLIARPDIASGFILTLFPV